MQQDTGSTVNSELYAYVLLCFSCLFLGQLNIFSRELWAGCAVVHLPHHMDFLNAEPMMTPKGRQAKVSKGHTRSSISFSATVLINSAQ